MLTDKDLVSIQQARQSVERAAEAQRALAEFTQSQIDRVFAAMTEAALAEAERLAELAHRETGYGNVADKTIKNRFAALCVYEAFRDLKTVGIIRETETLIEMADPRGVVAAIIPSTNPTSTTIYKILIALKARNSIVLSPHPAAVECIAETARVLRDAAVAEGVPADAIGWLTVATLEGTQELMKHRLTAIILATGGLGLVRAAYSSGKPAFGVGPGNVPAYIERSANVTKAVADIITGKCFDNGTICSSEQAIITDRALDGAVREELTRHGAYWLSPEEIRALEPLVITPTHTVNPAVVGRPAWRIAEMAGFSVPPTTRVLVAELQGVGKDYPLSLEKLSPILAYYTVPDWRAAADLCQAILRFGGTGHTLAIHSQDRRVVREFALRQPAARIVVNTPAPHGSVGLTTDLPPSMTLGCGSWGGNITSDNISPLHLLDIKRVAFETKPHAALRLAEAEPRVARAEMAPTPEPLRIDRATLEAMVEQVLLSKLAGQATTPRAVAPPPAPPSEPAPPAPRDALSEPACVPAGPSETNPQSSSCSESPRPAVVDFVCEEDVKKALAERRKISIHSRTIITPAARDLGEAHDVFVRE
jgi:acetaldehyde dehydrogenase (acetylating)